MQGQPDLEVGGERVWQPHVAWKGTQDQVPHLDAVRGNHVAECKVIVTEKLGEVVQ